MNPKTFAYLMAPGFLLVGMGTAFAADLHPASTPERTPRTTSPSVGTPSVATPTAGTDGAHAWSSGNPVAVEAEQADDRSGTPRRIPTGSVAIRGWRD